MCVFLLSGIPVISIPAILVICLLQSGLSVYWITGPQTALLPSRGRITLSLGSPKHMHDMPYIPHICDPRAQGTDPGAQATDLGAQATDLGAQAMDPGVQAMDLGTQATDLGAQALDPGSVKR